jgi:O-methyltransferase
VFRRRQPALAPDPLLETASAQDREILERCADLTLIGTARLLAVVDAARYCVRRGLDGAFVECGVWRGGAVLAMLLALQQEGVTDRDVHLYDTFEGMTQPTEADTSPFQRPAAEVIGDQERFDLGGFSSDQVREVLVGSGYPGERLHLHAGPVEETLPDAAPERIALLRLDTDWYESTRHELEHLYPRLVEHGVLIVDDYGHWDGARRALDEYAATQPALLFHRTDYTGRLAIKA